MDLLRSVKNLFEEEMTVEDENINIMPKCSVVAQDVQSISNLTLRKKVDE